MRVLCVVIFKLWKLILKILLFGISWELYLALWAYLVFHVGHLSKDLYAVLIIVSSFLVCQHISFTDMVLNVLWIVVVKGIAWRSYWKF